MLSRAWCWLASP